ncbi:MAG TPA: hypothetical protein VK097_01135 [Lentibacillus sp.]|uniref:hypothetical protein n=1 Tax=Lentibacillus sp. TaxID=1925746 RepID=UPI002B4AC3E0|nr:hypothetical protein [Lentibacillus sp.]HLR61026.1 hypothetical protein [Lentibacillus sp.]
MSVDEIDWEHQMDLEEERRQGRVKRSKELQELYFPLFKMCADYFFERLEKTDRIELDGKSDFHWEGKTRNGG